MTKLVKFEADYADEFDVHGFRVMSKPDWDDFVSKAEKVNYPIEIYFGTNEAIEVDSFKELMRSFKVTELNETDAKCISQHFNNYANRCEFGWDPIDHIIDKYHDQNSGDSYEL